MASNNTVQFEFQVNETPLTQSIQNARNQIQAIADTMNEMVVSANQSLSNVSEQFDNMGNNAEEAAKNSDNLGNSIGGIGKKLVGILAAVVAVKKLIDTVKWLYDVMTTQADAENKLEQALKTTGNAAGYSADQLKQFAAARQEVTKFGDEATIAATSIAASFKNLHGETFLRTIELSQDLATALGTDLNNATKTLSQALNDPVKGMRQLESVGIKLSDSQKKLVTDLTETGKVAEAQKILLDEVSKSYGGAAEGAATTFSGALQQIQNRIGDIGEIIGAAFGKLSSALMPFLDSFVSMLESNVVPAFTKFGEVIENLKEPITNVFETIYDVFSNTFSVWYETVERVYNQIKDALIPIFEDFGLSGEGLMESFSGVADFFSNVFGTALTLIGDIITKTVVPAFEFLSKAIETAINAIIPIVQPVVETLSSVFLGLIKVIESVGNVIGRVFGVDLMGTKMIQTAKDAAKHIKDTFKNVSVQNNERNQQRQIERNQPKEKKEYSRPQITFDSQVDTSDKQAEKDKERLKKLDEKYALDLSKFNQDQENRLNDLRTKHLIQLQNASNKSEEEKAALAKQQAVEEQALAEETMILKDALQKEYEAKRRNASEMELQDIRNQTSKELSDIKNNAAMEINDNKYEKPQNEKEEKKKESKSNVGNTEALEATYKRISMAMNQNEPEDKTTKEVKELKKQDKEEMDKQNKVIKNVETSVNSLLMPLKDICKKLDDIGGLA